MDRLFSTLHADLIIKKDYIYYARILIKKNQNYPKLLVELDKANAELTAVRGKNESLKGAAKEKEKVNEAPLAAKVSDLQNNVNTIEKDLAKAFESYEKAITFEGEDAGLIQEKAYSYYNLRYYNEAAETWKRLLSKGKDSDENYLQIAKPTTGKEFDKAEEILNQMIAKYPDQIQGYLWSARNASAKDPDSKLGIGKQKFTALIEKASSDSVKYATEIFDALRYLGYNALQSKLRFGKAITPNGKS